MKIYHFLSEKWAFEALKKQRIKLSRFDNLNDPFELMAMSLEDEFERKIMIDSKDKINNRVRLLCCSKAWVSPLLWGNYADKHRGIALELEVPDYAISPITYEEDRPPFDLRTLKESNDVEALNKLFTTKYKQWSYEEEVRVLFTKDDFFSSGGMDFHKLGNEIKLVGLVLGPLNKAKLKDISSNIPKGMEIEITTTRTAFRSFGVVHQKEKPPFALVG